MKNTELKKPEIYSLNTQENVYHNKLSHQMNIHGLDSLKKYLGPIESPVYKYIPTRFYILSQSLNLIKMWKFNISFSICRMNITAIAMRFLGELNFQVNLTN